MMAKWGRIRLRVSAQKWLDNAIYETGITVLQLTPRIALESCNLPGNFHKDPPDRIVAATARIHNTRLITKDKNIIDYSNAKTVW